MIDRSFEFLLFDLKKLFGLNIWLKYNIREKQFYNECMNKLRCPKAHTQKIVPKAIISI